jgi:hypothetical protein
MSAYGMSVPNDFTTWADIPQYWAQEYYEGTGITYGDLVKFQAENSLMNLLAIEAYCKENDLSLSKDQLNNIDAEIQNIIKNGYNNSKAVFNSTLSRFVIDDKILKEIRKIEALADVFGKHLFDQTDGKRPISTEVIDMIYEEECIRVKHVLIFLKPGTKDVDGKDIEYTEEELAEVQAKIDDIYNRLVAGEDIDGLLSESADSMPADGYTISRDTEFMPEFLETAFSLKMGEVGKAEVDDRYHGMHIIQRIELLPADQAVADINTGSTWRSTISRSVQSAIISDELKPFVDKIEVNRDEADLFDIASSAVMFDCPELWYR